MSTLTVTTFSDSTNSIGTSTVMKATPKTTCSYKGTGVLYINDSINISSLTDIKAGDYRLNHTNSFTANTYPVVCSAAHHQDNIYPGLATYAEPGPDTTRTTATCRQQIFQSVQVDSPLLNFVAAGTLA